MELQGKIALITGAGRGIGRAIARDLADRGVSVALLGRTEEQIRAEAEAISSVGGRALSIVCDLRTASAAQRAVETVREHFGGLNILINNAGVGRFATVAEMDPADWDAVLRTNLDGVFYITRAALPLMFETANPSAQTGGDGFIVNIGSLAGKTGFVNGAAYCASKWGLIGFTESLMLEVRDKGIRTSIVMPGSVDTTFNVKGLNQSEWKLTDRDITDAVLGILEASAKAHISRVEIRPNNPPPKR